MDMKLVHIVNQISLNVVLAMFVEPTQILIEVTSELDALFPFCILQLGTAIV
jgi:hypothetical protein